MTYGKLGTQFASKDLLGLGSRQAAAAHQHLLRVVLFLHAAPREDINPPHEVHLRGTKGQEDLEFSSAGFRANEDDRRGVLGCSRLYHGTRLQE
ncbi:MAG: hypothetical protein A2W10_08280 [Deltaproteobacteria bacterium RBG_16_55_12]|nr:MAG: hypothetical protein A2W10_08280 [Deltaproteobacteria bacterium RBG_16_55_12]